MSQQSLGKTIKKEHLKDIDFRSHEVRSKSAKEDFIKWYEELQNRPRTERIEGQLSMLSSVLWYLLSPKEYKKLIKRDSSH